MVELKGKCVVILSGGPDSVTTMFWAINEGYETHALTFNYGQKAKIEIERSKNITENLDVEHIIIDSSDLEKIFRGVTSLVDEELDVSESFTTPIIVPFRNGIFLSIAVAYADAISANHVFYGAHQSDASFYPDCRPEFYQAFEIAAKIGTERDIIIDAPFSQIPKSEIIQIASSLEVPLEETWSCYLNGPKHCGKCESCNNRKRAFKDADIKDPTIYLE